MMLGYLTKDCLVLGELWRILFGFWQTLEIITRCIYLNPNNVTTVIKGTLVLHNILTLPNDNNQNEVVEDCVQVFDDAFEDLTKQDNRSATAAVQVHTYFTEYFCSVCRAVDWQYEAAHVI